MAPVLSPVCTDALKFQNPFPFRSSNRWRRLARPRPTTSISGRRRDCKIKATARGYSAQEAVADDYYSVLGLVFPNFFFFLFFFYNIPFNVCRQFCLINRNNRIHVYACQSMPFKSWDPLQMEYITRFLIN